MAKVLVNEENLTNIANAIREKNESTDSYKPGEMAEAIQNIQSGDPELEASFISSIDDTLGANVTKLPDSLTNIRTNAFYQCKNLALTELPSGLTSIGIKAFYQCTNLALTELPDSLTSIGQDAFYYCTNLALTELPSGLTSIDGGAFRYCTNLALTELPSGLTSIDSYTFYQCTNLALTELPDSLTSIGQDAFNYCTNLTLIKLPGGVGSIGYGAFRNCTKLQEFTCQENIGSMNSYVFESTNLTKFCLPNATSIPSIQSNTFSHSPISSKTGYIYVPDALVDSFKTATNWSFYADQIKPISELEVSA